MSTLHLLREQIAANRRAYQLTVAIVVAGLALFGLLVTLVWLYLELLRLLSKLRR